MALLATQNFDDICLSSKLTCEDNAIRAGGGIYYALVDNLSSRLDQVLACDLTHPGIGTPQATE